MRSIWRKSITIGVCIAVICVLGLSINILSKDGNSYAEVNAEATAGAAASSSAAKSSASSSENTAADKSAAAENKASAKSSAAAAKAKKSSASLKKQTIKAKIYKNRYLKKKYKSKKNESIVVRGKMPKGAYVTAYPVKAKIGAMKTLAAFDITVYTKNHQKFEPEDYAGNLQVTIRTNALAAQKGKYVSVYHVVNGSREKIKTEKKQSRSKSVKFTASSFSPYVLAAADSVPGTIQTADSRADGIEMNLFDYASDDSWNNNYDNPSRTGINSADGKTLRNFLFFGYGTEGKTLNNYTGNNNGVARAMQGIVNPLLSSDGYPYLDVNRKTDSLAYLFSTTEAARGKTTYADVNHLLTKDANGYYRYDSDTNYAYYDTGSDNSARDFKVYDGTFNVTGSSDSSIGFFPFNEYNSNKGSVSYCDSDGYYDHHFGMTMGGKFLMPKDSKVNGKEMVFDFSGDDDVWVYIDDVLVLDIGGIHGRVGGSINFTTGTVKVDNAMTVSGKSNTNTNTNTVTGTKSTITQIFQNAGRTYDASDYSLHTIKFFYLERGGCYSNCKLTFNMPMYKPGTVTVSKKLSGEAAEDYADTEFSYKLYRETSKGSGSYQLYTGHATATKKDGTNTSITIGSDGIFNLKAGESLTTDEMDSSLSYYVEEVGVDGKAFTTNINDVKTDNNSGTVRSTTATVSTRPQVAYENIAHKKNGDLKIYKTNNADDPLSGVEFKLYAAAVDSSGNWTKASDTVKGTMTTGSDGTASCSLEPGKYLLYETKACSGYVLPADPWKVTVDNKGNVSLADSSGTAVEHSTQDSSAYKIVNARIYELPSAGGMGTYWFTFAGMAVLMIALLLLIRNRRKEGTG